MIEMTDGRDVLLFAAKDVAYMESLGWTRTAPVVPDPPKRRRKSPPAPAPAGPASVSE